MSDINKEISVGDKVKYPTGSGEVALTADSTGVFIVLEDGQYKRVHGLNLCIDNCDHSKCITDMSATIHSWQIGDNESITGLAEMLYAAGFGYRKVEG